MKTRSATLLSDYGDRKLASKLWNFYKTGSHPLDGDWASRDDLANAHDDEIAAWGAKVRSEFVIFDWEKALG